MRRTTSTKECGIQAQEKELLEQNKREMEGEAVFDYIVIYCPFSVSHLEVGHGTIPR